MDADPERDRLMKALAERQQEESREMQERHARQIEEAHRASVRKHEEKTAEAAEDLRFELDRLPQAPTEMEVHRQHRLAAEHVTKLTHEQELLGIEIGVDFDLNYDLCDMKREHDQEIEAMNSRHEEEAVRYLREHEAAQRLSRELQDRQQARDHKLENDAPKRTR